MSTLLFGVLLTVCITSTVIAYFTYKYYVRKIEYEYKKERLSYDELVVADGGEEDE